MSRDELPTYRQPSGAYEKEEEKTEMLIFLFSMLVFPYAESSSSSSILITEGMHD